MTDKIRHTRQITIETHRITIIRTSKKPISAFCERCQTNVSVFALEQIAAFFRLTLTEVCQCVETNRLHLIENGRGIALICGSSLNISENKKF